MGKDENKNGFEKYAYKKWEVYDVTDDLHWKTDKQAASDMW